MSQPLPDRAPESKPFNPAPPESEDKRFLRALRYLSAQPFNRCDVEDLALTGQIELLFDARFIALVTSTRCELTDNGRAYLKMWHDAQLRSK